MNSDQATATATEPGPGRQVATYARNACEEILFALPELPLVFDRLGVRDRLLYAIQCMYVVLDSSALALVHREGLAEGSRLSGEVAAMLRAAIKGDASPSVQSTVERLEEVRQSLLQTTEEVAQIQIARRHELFGGHLNEALPKARPFRASRGVPQLHALARAPLMPYVLVEPSAPSPKPAASVLPPAPKSFEDLAALLADASSGDLQYQLEKQLEDVAQAPDDGNSTQQPTSETFAYTPQIEEVEMLRRIGRTCLEDIANYRSLRKPNAIESWLDQAPFEQRMLDSLDAFAAIGGAALPAVLLFHAEAKTPDPERAFAVALTLGCIEGRDTVAAAVMTMKQSAPEELPGWLEGFWLASNPAVDDEMVHLCTSRRADLVALGLEVLLARGTLTSEVMRPLVGRPDPAIAARVSTALALLVPRELAIAELEGILAKATDDEVFLAATESLLRRRHAPVLEVLREAVTSSSSSEMRVQGALWLLCLAARSTDLELLRSMVRSAPTPRLVRGLGRFGHTEGLWALRDTLEHGDTEVVNAAAEALERITGAGLREVVEELWEVELPPEALEAEGALPVPTRRIEKVVQDPNTWGTWLRAHERKLDARLRYRAGTPFVPAQILAELEAKGTPPAAREEAAQEYAVAIGASFRFSPSDWVERQQKGLVELRAAAQALRSTPGAWGFAGRTASRQWPQGASDEALVRTREPDELPRWGGAGASVVDAAASAADVEQTLPPGAVLPFAAALPFVAEVQPINASEIAIDQTLPPGILDAQRPVLPFQEGDARNETSQSADDQEDPTVITLPPAAIPRSAIPFDPIDISRTMAMPVITTLGPALPFPKSASDPENLFSSTVIFDMPASVGGASDAPPSTQPSDQLASARPVLPFQMEKDAEDVDAAAVTLVAPLKAATSTGVPELSLEAYASLCAKLAATPNDAEQIFHRYGLLTPESRKAVDDTWKHRLKREPSTYQEWQRLYKVFLERWRR